MQMAPLNTVSTNSVLYFFSTAEELLNFADFDIVETPVSYPNATAKTSVVWSVVGTPQEEVPGHPLQIVSEDPEKPTRQIVAEFSLKSYAEIFRDLADKAVNGRVEY